MQQVSVCWRMAHIILKLLLVFLSISIALAGPLAHDVPVDNNENNANVKEELSISSGEKVMQKGGLKHSASLHASSGPKNVEDEPVRNRRSVTADISAFGGVQIGSAGFNTHRRPGDSYHHEGGHFQHEGSRFQHGQSAYHREQGFHREQEEVLREEEEIHREKEVIRHQEGGYHQGSFGASGGLGVSHSTGLNYQGSFSPYRHKRDIGLGISGEIGIGIGHRHHDSHSEEHRHHEEHHSGEYHHNHGETSHHHRDPHHEVSYHRPGFHHSGENSHHHPLPSGHF